jgi:hypothetical protein
MNPQFLLLLFLVSALTSSFSQARAGRNSKPAAEMERKLEHLLTNSKRQHPDPAPTVFTEEEINAYLASGEVQLPAGVESVRFEEEPGVLTANLKVDFDQLKAQHNSGNPLLQIFTGTHAIDGRAHAHGADGSAFVNVDSVSLDGIEIPRLVLQLFVDQYLRPQYPQAGLDSQFALPARIETVVVGSHQLTITQS